MKGDRYRARGGRASDAHPSSPSESPVVPSGFEVK